MRAAPALPRSLGGRYARQLRLREVGPRGQRALSDARVLLVGAGGLGAPAALYLAAAGVGHLGIVDFDRVDLSNLQRQVIYATDEVGWPKAATAADRLRALNPEIEVEVHDVRLDRKTIPRIIDRYDLVLDGADNFATRYLVNDACVLAGRPDVYASVYRFEGQATVFDARVGPCYRCLYPEPPPPGSVPSCAQGGVLGVVPGLLGLVQATEALKLILGVGEPLVGRLLLVDTLSMRTRELRIRKSPDCPICSAHPTQRELVDYTALCGDAPVDPALGSVAASRLEADLRSATPPTLIDVRTLAEWSAGHLSGAHHLPLDQLGLRLGELPEGPIVFYCQSGARSATAVYLAQQAGRSDTASLIGGLDGWSGPLSRSTTPAPQRRPRSVKAGRRSAA